MFCMPLFPLSRQRRPTAKKLANPQAIAAALTAVLVAFSVCAEEPPAAYATMYIGGNYFRRNAADSKYTILSTYLDRAAAMKGEAPPAGLATFGWFESGEVMLLQYTEYLPSMLQANGRRNVKPSKFPLDPKASLGT